MLHKYLAFLYITMFLAAPMKPVFAQDSAYARVVIANLCSEEFAGRGYVNDGDATAANFIRKEFKTIGAVSLTDNYYQSFNFPVITFPSKVELTLDDVELIPGYDFLTNPGCPAIKGKFDVLKVDSAMLDNTPAFEKLSRAGLRSIFLRVDGIKEWKLLHPERANLILENAFHAKGLLYTNIQKLTWSVATSFADFPIFYVLNDRAPQFIIRLNCTIESVHRLHGTQNVIGMIKGTVQPDSFLVVGAHYDHLGMLGEQVIFPGANDNASGIAMMLCVMKHYSKSPPPISMIFIAFAGEEAGLIGSSFFVESPVVPLDQIKFMLNLDLMATGDEGVTAVNGTIYTNAFQQLQTCNTINQFLPVVNARGKAANSDHYPFSEAGVPAMFLYLMGNYHHYHDTDDTSQAITLSKFKEAFGLIRCFLDEMTRADQPH